MKKRGLVVSTLLALTALTLVATAVWRSGYGWCNEDCSYTDNETTGGVHYYAFWSNRWLEMLDWAEYRHADFHVFWPGNEHSRFDRGSFSVPDEHVPKDGHVEVYHFRSEEDAVGYLYNLSGELLAQVYYTYDGAVSEATLSPPWPYELYPSKARLLEVIRQATLAAQTQASRGELALPDSWEYAK